MKYDVSHCCGHTQEHVLFGPHKDRDRKLVWLADRPCTDCWRESNRKKREEANEAAAAAAGEAGLPALTGSPKQVAWANSLRWRVMKPLLLSFRDETQGDPEFRRFITWLRGKTDSRYWIDHRRARMDLATLPIMELIHVVYSGQPGEATWRDHYHLYRESLAPQEGAL